MLRVSDLEAGYGAIKALKGVSFELPEGAIVSLLGSNGAGKSTTLRAISGIIRPTAGTINLGEKRIDGLSAEEIVRLGIVHVPEGRRLFPGLTVMENLMMGAYVRRDPAGVKKDLGRVVDYFSILGERFKQHAGTLSGGEQQMLAIGRALMARPAYLLLDEPSLGLAPKVIVEIFRIIKTINQDGTAILLVEQNAHMALRIAHFGYVLQVGTIPLSGTAEELRADDEIVRSYLGRRSAGDR